MTEGLITPEDEELILYLSEIMKEDPVVKVLWPAESRKQVTLKDN